MRRARPFPVDGSHAGVFHCISRVVDRRFALGEGEKEVFLRILRKCEVFYGVRVLTYCLMSNHFHVLVEVPEPQPSSDADVLHRVSVLYSQKVADGVASQINGFRARGLGHLAERLLSKFTSRMFNLSNFMKSLKQRFSSYYNRGNDRKGTLWEERFRSVIVQADERVLTVMALYIDLNPVRAGIVKDPSQYRFSGYAEALAGATRAREGLARVVSSRNEPWKGIHERYRELLFQAIDEKAIMSTEEGRPPFGPFRHRIRSLTEGWILGSTEFVKEWRERNQWRFGQRRCRFGEDGTPGLPGVACC